uniref:DUF4126 domain-containing protein n=1 Tax=Thermosporothrix sp. COM3 TaxID=2490863 RepID=A0A455T1D9_9CHLR|nr:hypothetical protein KTC_59350 [Thermosporothrix sp. COM3]
MDIGTSYGLALSSGINAYLPLLSFAIAVRWLHLYTVQPPFEYVTSDWFMIVLAILALADLFADKIPGVDHVWDVIHTVLRPLAGALVAAVSQHQVSGAGLVVPVVLGAGLAGLAHVTKASVRVTSTATSVGFLNPIISVLEDIGMLIGTALSLLAPIVMVIVIVLFVLFFLLTVPRLLKRWRNRRMKRAVAGS